METDAKNPRQAGTVAKNPRGTDAKNPPQLAPLQKTPVTVWNVPTVAKNPYYRRKKPQPQLLYMNYSNFCIMQYEYIYIYMDITLIFGNVKKSAHQRSSKQLTLIRKPMNFAGCSMPHCWDTSIWIVLGVKYKSYIYLYVRIHGMLWLQQVKLFCHESSSGPTLWIWHWQLGWHLHQGWNNIYIPSWELTACPWK